MLGLDIVNLTNILTDTGILDASVQELIETTQYLFVGQDPNLQSPLKNHVARWQEYVRFRLTKVSQTDRFQTEMEMYQKVVHWNETEFFTSIEETMKKMEGISSFYSEARRLLSDANNLRNPMFPHYFCDQWYKRLAEEIQLAQVRELEEHKQALLDDLYQRMDTLKDIDVLDDGCESDPNVVKRYWNMASAKLSKSDIGTIKKHAEVLKKHKALREIAQELGRQAHEVKDQATEQEKYVEELTIVEEQSQQATDDIVGIHQKDDVNRLLPNELLFLSHPELEVVFYKHLVDKELLNYQLEGKRRKLKQVITKKKVAATDESDEGPFIVCIDASGSMQGFPEQAAKALAYGLMQIALADNRDCYVMIFSTQVIKYELTKQDGLREVSDFLSSTFHGGTDLEPALSASLDLMEGEKYQYADLIVLSDFVAPKQNDKLISRVEELKEKGNRFHAVSFSKYGNPQLLSLFDHFWSYHPTLFGRVIKGR
ncbi:ATPase RavA stimulator ViaA [Vibrio viridaestus]|uniref:ATPase RavA stimulator ViaA n=1 Tax=Vibrio viridaestus TaxID=2487322 RepID=A0A3N9U520_9VIBR|nr:ATPase RavA stimulator ViaA [Vibrio viridaestus]RQW64792.1 ATPase RavA stimulator ViaA [Vibrio viridaestus]